jgi:anaerobic glycerol-3-phosphate dehydrogenase
MQMDFLAQQDCTVVLVAVVDCQMDSAVLAVAGVVGTGFDPAAYCCSAGKASVAAVEAVAQADRRY